MEIRNEQRAHRADSAQLLQRFLRIEQEFKLLQKGHQESLEREREFERRSSSSRLPHPLLAPPLA